jgi:hypothetical protein
LIQVFYLFFSFAIVVERSMLIAIASIKVIADVEATIRILLESSLHHHFIGFSHHYLHQHYPLLLFLVLHLLSIRFLKVNDVLLLPQVSFLSF